MSRLVHMRSLGLALIGALIATGCVTSTETHIEITLPPGAATPPPPAPIVTSAAGPFGGDPCKVLTAADFGQLNVTLNFAVPNRYGCAYLVSIAARKTEVDLSYSSTDAATWAASKAAEAKAFAGTYQDVTGVGEDAYTCVCFPGTLARGLVVEDKGYALTFEGDDSQTGIGDLPALESLARSLVARA